MSRTPKEKLNWKTSLGTIYEHLGIDAKPGISHLRIIGCLCHVLNKRLDKGDKLAPKTLQSWLVGFVGSNLFRVWILSMNRIVPARDVVINENVLYKDRQTSSLNNVSENESFDESFADDEGVPSLDDDSFDDDFEEPVFKDFDQPMPDEDKLPPPPNEWFSVLDHPFANGKEPCVFVNGRITVMFYVDDIAILARREHLEEEYLLRQFPDGQVDKKRSRISRL